MSNCIKAFFGFVNIKVNYNFHNNILCTVKNGRKVKCTDVLFTQKGNSRTDCSFANIKSKANHSII